MHTHGIIAFDSYQSTVSSGNTNNVINDTKNVAEATCNWKCIVYNYHEENFLEVSNTLKLLLFCI
jgi:hypothetical protein